MSASNKKGAHYRSLPRQPGPGLSPESYVYNLLYEVPVPLPGQALRLYVPPPEPHLDSIPVVSIVVSLMRRSVQ